MENPLVNSVNGIIDNEKPIVNGVHAAVSKSDTTTAAMNGVDRVDGASEVENNVCLEDNRSFSSKLSREAVVENGNVVVDISSPTLRITDSSSVKSSRSKNGPILETVNDDFTNIALVEDDKAVDSNARQISVVRLSHNGEVAHPQPSSPEVPTQQPCLLPPLSDSHDVGDPAENGGAEDDEAVLPSPSPRQQAWCSAASLSTTLVSDGISYVRYENESQMPDIMRLITKDLSEPYSIYTYRYFIHNWPKLCFLAMDEDKCVGAIVCKLDVHKKMANRGYIAMLAVDNNYRRRKIGSTLVRKAIRAMILDESSSCDEVVLETEITNTSALRLYENLGFVRDKRLFRYYLNGVDALRLKLWLR